MGKQLLENNKMAMRQKKKLQLLRQMNANVTLQVLGTGATGAPSALFLSTDHTNYIFNCGEGTQRLANEHHLKLTKLDHIFVTRPSWKNIGGLPGLLLTLQEYGVNEINIHSLSKMHNLLDALKTFIFLPQLSISYNDLSEHEPYKDNIMTIRSIHITKFSKTTDENSLKLDNKSEYKSNEHGKRVVDATETGENCAQVAKRFKTTADIVCYACEINPKRGKLLLEKCLELGLDSGPHLQLLKKGINVIKNDGTVFMSKDVCEEEGSISTFIVIDCPAEEYLDSVVNHPDFLKYQNVPSKEQEMLCIFHFTPDKIFDNPKYQNWINTFPQTTQHVILNSKNCCMGSDAVFKNQYILNMLHSEIFPLLSKDSLKEDKETENDNIIRARTMQTLEIRPNVKQVTTPKIYSKSQEHIESIWNIPMFADTLTELKKNISMRTEQLNITNTCEYPRVLMLGTGSSVPNKVRNISAILLRIDENNSILLDCGEGTIGQIIRYFGNANVDNILRSIKAIYISHVHADHHLGIIGLLQEREKYTKEPIYILTTKQIELWLQFYHHHYEPISHLYKLVNNYDLYLNKHILSNLSETLLYYSLNVKRIDTILVKHCKHSFGVAITLKDNKKIVYSGDTMPCENLITLGKNCDLLIHEATMEDSLKQLARKKYHSTSSEAINAGKLMNAKFTLLTHFSQRYSKLPLISEKEENVGLAYDNMDIKLSQLRLLPLFYPCLKLMFYEYFKETERRIAKQHIKN